MAKVQAASTQDHIPIAGVRDGVIILKDGSYRLILSVSPINFSLKSEQEQNALIFKYQSFLNSLHFPIQIVVQSKKLDLTPYLQKMQTLLKNQTNELIKIQTEDYIDFVSQLINVANIMSKKFFVGINFTPLSLPKLSFADRLLGHKVQTNVLRISNETFATHHQELMERGNQIASGLGSLGLRVQQLSTQQILEMFYNLYNPEESGKERLINLDEMQSTVITDKKETPQDSGAENDLAKPKIDNQTVVEAVSRTQTPPVEAEKPQPVAATPNPSPDETPPIKERLEKSQSATVSDSLTSPVVSSNPSAPPPAPLQNDNYQIR